MKRSILHCSMLAITNYWCLPRRETNHTPCLQALPLLYFVISKISLSMLCTTQSGNASNHLITRRFILTVLQSGVVRNMVCRHAYSCIEYLCLLEYPVCKQQSYVVYASANPRVLDLLLTIVDHASLLLVDMEGGEQSWVHLQATSFHKAVDNSVGAFRVFMIFPCVCRGLPA